MPVRLIDVAKRAGVSIQAVSVVINGSRSTAVVGKGARQRVLKAAREMGYEPHAAASALARQSSKMIGLITLTFYDPLLIPAIARTEELCAQHGYTLQISSTQKRPDWVSLLRRSQVDYLVSLSPYSFGFSHLRVPAPLRKRVVTVGPLHLSGEEKAFPRQWGLQVGWDDVRVGRIAAEHLLKLGHKRVAVLVGKESHQSPSPRIAGFMQAMNTAGAQTIVIRAQEEDTWDKTPCAAAMTEELLASGAKVSAVFMRNDMLYPGIMSTLSRRGLCVPRDVSLMGSMASAFGDLTSVERPYVQAIDHVLEPLFNTGALPGKDITLEPQIHAGNTCAKI